MPRPEAAVAFANKSSGTWTVSFLSFISHPPVGRIPPPVNASYHIRNRRRLWCESHGERRPLARGCAPASRARRPRWGYARNASLTRSHGQPPSFSKEKQQTQV